MDKQKLAPVVMVPVVLIALFVAWKSYSATLAPPARPIDTRGQPGGPPAGLGGGGPTPAQMMDTMAKELTLSDTQKTQIAAIQAELADKRKALPKDMPRDKRREEMTANRAAADVKIKALLSPDQQTKYDAMQAKRRAQMQAGRAQGGGPGGGSGGGMRGGPGGGGSGGGAPAATK
jgi:protein CpxP